MSSREITLIDAGTGNLHSVQNAFEHLGARVLVTAEPGEVLHGGRLVLPGVGAFGRFMGGLRERGLEPAVVEAVRQGHPLLGICVGMQALFDVGEELGETAGLGLLPGRVVRFPAQDGLKVPHTGWNQIWRQRASGWLDGIPDGSHAYFNHSYYCAAEPGDWLAATEYGLRYASIVQRENISGVQFHPEKSQRVGLAILEGFLKS
ncbi:MAG TPA: imidazole glycerol phosphate synthase subunit HisH [Anaerolineaceae bacterium]